MLNVTFTFATTDAALVADFITRDYLFPTSNAPVVSRNKKTGVYSVSASIRPAFDYAIKAFMRENKGVIA